MLFRKASDVPKEVSDAHVTEWYLSLSDQERAKLRRYLAGADVSSSYSFLSSVAAAAMAEDNHSFAVPVCEECLNGRLTDMQRFTAAELLIEAYMGTRRYEDAKLLCERNLGLYPAVKDVILAANGGSLPELCCRNRYFDIVVGVESGYDEAFVLLDRFFDMGLISGEDLAFRRQSLKIRRLQRSFDGVFTYSYKD
jgi:hypothetical protein